MGACLICGKETGAFVGLCDACCRMIKAKTDAFKRNRQHLENHLDVQPDAAAPAQPKEKKESEKPWWPEDTPL